MFDAAYYSTCASGTVKKSGLPEEKVSIDENTLAFLNTVGIGLPFYVDKSDDDLVASWEFDIRYTIALIPGIGHEPFDFRRNSLLLSERKDI
jgi:hypothetical protein